MRARSLIIVILSVLIIGGSLAMAQEKTPKEMKPGEGVMMWSAMVGPGLLHEHMNSMTQQMSSMIWMMSRMMKSGKMDAKQMKTMSEIMEEMSTMMSETPAVRKMMEEQPDMAMKDMGKMMKTMSELMDKMAEMMAQMPK